MARSLIVGLSLFGVADASYKCPGSPAFVHAWSEQTTSVTAGCDAVMTEIADRVSGKNGWYDPHNRGTYSITSSTTNEMDLQRKTGDGKYTDKITLQFEASGSSCVVKGCSESQVTSVLDFSTNFCDIRMLTCGSKDGCKPSGLDFTSTITDNQQSLGSKNAMSDCLKVYQTNFLASHAESSYKCPGSAAFVHAWSEQTASITTGCKEVMTEISDRVSGKNGWYDPHNRGTYTITRNTEIEIELQRTTGDGKYTDKIRLQFEASGSSCIVKGCSESQVTSVLDFSTNFCDIRMLTCGSKDGCKNGGLDLTSTITDNQQSLGSKNSMSDCLKMQQTNFLATVQEEAEAIV